MEKKIKVVIVDDLKSARELVKINLEFDPIFEVVGFAANGKEALEKADQLRPDLITMDVMLPDMKGFEVVKMIMDKRPTPIVMITSAKSSESGLHYEALKAGAVELLEKSSLYTFEKDFKVGKEFAKKMRFFSELKLLLHSSEKEHKKHETTAIQPSATKAASMDLKKVVAIGSSTGGPNALRKIFCRIPSEVPAAFLIVQHMAKGFIKDFADSLNHESHIEVRVAQNGDSIVPGVALFAPDGVHMEVTPQKSIHLSHKLPINGHRPAASHLLPSVAEVFGRKAMGVILTGMGADGAEGMKVIKECGGKTIAQNEETCIVFGMPKEAIELGVVDHVLPINDIAEKIMKML